MTLAWNNDVKCLGATPSGRANASVVPHKRSAIVYAARSARMSPLTASRSFGGLTCSGPSNEMFMVDMEQFVWRAPLQHVRAAHMLPRALTL